jgi:hypothetical protein
MRYEMAVDKADLGFLVGSNRCVSTDVSSLILSITMLLFAFARAVRCPGAHLVFGRGEVLHRSSIAIAAKVSGARKR